MVWFASISWRSSGLLVNIAVMAILSSFYFLLFFMYTITIDQATDGSCISCIVQFLGLAGFRSV